MQKRQGTFILFLTIAVAIILAALVGSTIHFVNKNVTQNCYDELTHTSKQLAQELYKTTDMDRTILTAMATIIAESDISDESELCEIMKSYNTDVSYVTYVELLRPDNTILDSNGTVRDVSGGLDFTEEAKKGAYVSNMAQSTLDPDERVIRSAVPVMQNQETIYMLYGVVRLSEFAEEYSTDIYDGEAYVYLEDGDTGDFLLDTWHKSFGNIRDFSERKMVEGFDFDKAIEDMENGIGGDLGFVSNTTGQVLFMHYEPVGVNNWNVVITVEKQHALKESEEINAVLYRMAALVGVVVFFYMASVLFVMSQAYLRVRRIGMHDQTTGLENRNAYDAFIHTNQEREFESIICIYVDANGLHEINNKFGHQVGDQMLRIIADALKGNFGSKSLYRVGGDEFVVFTETDSFQQCQEKMKTASRQIESHDYHIAYGIAHRENEMGVVRVTREADEIMLENKKLYYANHDRRNR